jgi:hypothetical protein
MSDNSDSKENSLSSFFNNDSSESLSNTLDHQLDLLEQKLNDAEDSKSRISKKSLKPIVHNGYTLDINIDTFKTTVCEHFCFVIKIHF